MDKTSRFIDTRYNLVNHGTNNEAKLPIIAHSDAIPFAPDRLSIPIPEEVLDASPHGVYAYRNIVEHAEQHAKYIEGAGEAVMRIAGKYNKECQQKAADIRQSAKDQADAAVRLTKHFDSMSRALRMSAVIDTKEEDTGSTDQNE